MPQQGPIEAQIHTPHSLIHPRLVVSSEKVHKSDGVICPPSNEVEVLFDRVMMISFQVVSWPNHYDNMVFLGKDFPKIR